MSAIRIVPVNTIDATFVTRLGACLEERFLFEAIVAPRIRVPKTALNGVRKQLFSGALTTQLAATQSRAPDDDIAVILGITDYDLYKTSHRFVFGDADAGTHTAVVSRFRLDPEFYGDPADENRLFQRTLKEAIRQIGAVLGLRSCVNGRCAMVNSGSIFEADNKLPYLCDACEKKVRANR